MRSYMRIGLVLTVALATVGSGFSQAPAPQAAPPAQNRIPQQIIINGQAVNGAWVQAANGGMQAYTCPNPEQYATADGASHGWACYDAASTTWLLNALPPAQAAQTAPQSVPAPPPAAPPAAPPVASAPPATVVYQAPPVVYTQPATVVYGPGYPVVYAPAYPPGVILGAAAITAFGRIAAAGIYSSHGFYYPYYVRGWRR